MGSAKGGFCCWLIVIKASFHIHPSLPFFGVRSMRPDQATGAQPVVPEYSRTREGMTLIVILSSTIVEVADDTPSRSIWTDGVRIHHCIWPIISWNCSWNC